VSILNNKQKSASLLPYVYDVIVAYYSDDIKSNLTGLFNSLRPYGGSLFIEGITDESIFDTLGILKFQNAELHIENDIGILTRTGALPGSDQWTHQYGGASNRVYSDDNLVKPPLGTLWFGGPSNLNTLPKAMGPIPQVAGGRLFLLGVETLSARCVYTGRKIWIKEIPGIGHPFTYLDDEERFQAGNAISLGVRPGANFTGSPYVSLEDMVYLINGDKLFAIDAASGNIEVEYRLPDIDDIEFNEFGHIMVYKDYLITTLDPQRFEEGTPGREYNWDATSSSVLLVMDRHNGKILWSRRANKGFRHNAIVAGNDKLYIIDGFSERLVELLERRGLIQDEKPELLALDLQNGQKVWHTNNEIFGTWLGYYEDKDILLQGGRRGQRVLTEWVLPQPEDEPGDRLIAHSGLSGDIIWESKHPYSGPLGLHPEMIIPGKPGEPAFDPYTGNLIYRNHPITGGNFRWDWHKYYGCGTMNSSKYLVMFRSGTAGYADLLNYGGTGNIGGIRTGCVNNMIAADGVLNAPEYTRTCTCSYPLQTNIGLVHMPQAGIEAWTINRITLTNRPVKSLGINFGGQGNRRENGVLWLEYPKVYGAGPDLPLKVESNSEEFFRNHATWIKNSREKYDWVASYGIKGVSSVEVYLIPEGETALRHYNVTLYFTEPDDLKEGERVFDVFMQGEKILAGFDIALEAGESRRVISKKFRRIGVDGALRIDFSANGDRPPVISGIEIEMDEVGLAASDN
jgi:hypothetical protein